MMEKILKQSVDLKGYQVAFILGQKVLAKTSFDWVEVKGDHLTLTEWEDLKDICLQGNQKIQLETKGIVEGSFNQDTQSWKFVFIEKKECYRAHFTLIRKNQSLKTNIQNPFFWEVLKKDHGLMIVVGGIGQGKTTLLREFFQLNQNSKLSLVGLHTNENDLSWPNEDFLVRLDNATYEEQHIDAALAYEGLERVIVDLNDVTDWTKLIKFSESGRTVHLSVEVSSIDTLFQRIFSELSDSLLRRLLKQLNGVIGVRSVSGGNIGGDVSNNTVFLCEFVLFKPEEIRNFISEKDKISYTDFCKSSWFQSAETYQSLNQVIIQNLVRRQIDVPTAFMISDNPVELDSTLKKMGL